MTPEIRRELIDYLRTFVTEQRDARIQEVLSYRTRHVTVVIEDLYQTQNISAVMRTCECYGVQDVHVVEKENEFFIHDAIAMGSNKWLTLHNYPNEPGNVKKCISTLKERGYEVVATLPAENSLFVHQMPVEKPTAFMFGTELTGLSEEAVALADRCVKIPMYGFTESFNISNSVAILISQWIERLHVSNVDWHLSQVEKEELYLEWLQKSVRSSDFLVRNFLGKK